MVAPLFVIALLWERVDWRASRLFRPRPFTWHLGPLRRTLTVTNLASGLLLALIGAATIWIGLTTEAMPASGGWQARVAVRLQGYGRAITDTFSWVPGWAAALALLIWRALRQVGWIAGRGAASAETAESGQGIATKEETLEHRHA